MVPLMERISGSADMLASVHGKIRQGSKGLRLDMVRVLININYVSSDTIYALSEIVREGSYGDALARVVPYMATCWLKCIHVYWVPRRVRTVRITPWRSAVWLRKTSTVCYASLVETVLTSAYLLLAIITAMIQ